MAGGKDQRMWMRFPIDMHRDPKVTRLSDAAFRVFFEMNGEARLEGNDGVFAVEDAEFRWPPEHLEALVKSHPREPLVVRDGDSYVLRRFARHQLTEADRAHLAQVSRENGRRGGRPRKNPETQNNPEVTQAYPSVTQAKAESESESEKELPPTPSQSSPVSERASEQTDVTDIHLGIISGMGVDASKVRAAIESELGQVPSSSDLARVCAVALTDRDESKKLRNATGYVVASVKNREDRGKWLKVLAGEA